MAEAPLEDPGIRIRMYRVGFGDCFLITLPQTEGAAHILVDCGVHWKGDLGLLEKAAMDIAFVSGGKLALVIATHAHQDHISGFGKYQNLFRRLEVGEVWLPWTEDPNDPQAAELRRKQIALVEELREHFAASPPSPEALAAVENMAANESSLRFLRSGMGRGAKVRYLQAGDSADQPGGVSGLSVRLFGPPRDPEFLARMDPPAGQRYLRASSAAGDSAAVLLPFPQKWQREQDEGPALAPREEQRISALAAGAAEPLAFALDQAINNTSIVALLHYRGRHLLFPGDAQYGSWQAWLDQPGSRDLLAQVDFLKVSHHGSVNATPRHLVESLPRAGFAAMVSTQSTPWKSIPREPLLASLEERTGRKLIRSDSLPVPGAPKGPDAVLPKGAVKGPFWFDYLVPL